MQQHILQIIYLIASVTFIGGLKFLGNPATARKGNLIAAFGMVLAIFGTIFLYTTETGEHLHNLGFIFGALIVGTIIGWIVAKKVQMTAMPEMVSLFNGMGGACAMLISVIEFKHLSDTDLSLVAPGHLLTIVLGLIIGSVSFAGSIIAWGKLSGNVKDKSLGMQQLINIGLLVVIWQLICSFSIFDFNFKLLSILNTLNYFNVNRKVMKEMFMFHRHIKKLGFLLSAKDPLLKI